MLDGKFLCTLTAIIIAILAICNFEKKKTGLVENFMGLVPGGKLKPSSVGPKGMGTHSLGNIATLMNPNTAQQTNTLVQTLSGGLASVAGPINEKYHPNNQHMVKQHVNNYNMHQNKIEPFGFQVPPNMQKMLSPRGSAESFGMGTNIRYNKPSFEKMAYNNPSQYGNMVEENYEAKEQGCGVNGAPYQTAPKPPPAGFAAGNYGELINSLPKSAGESANLSLSNSLPIPTMESAGADGEDVINYNRMIIANPNSRTRSAGDMIRGDLVIAPCETGWFRPSANMTLDLQQGALMVMAGLQPADSNAAAGARVMASVGANYYAGLAMNEQQLSSISAMSDVQISRLP